MQEIRIYVLVIWLVVPGANRRFKKSMFQKFMCLFLP